MVSIIIASLYKNKGMKSFSALLVLLTFVVIRTNGRSAMAGLENGGRGDKATHECRSSVANIKEKNQAALAVYHQRAWTWMDLLTTYLSLLAFSIYLPLIIFIFNKRF